MSLVQLFAVTADGPRPLPLPEGATNVHEVFDGLPLGVYSALRTFQHNHFLHLEDHLDRTDKSMALLGWDYRLDREALRQALHEVCTAYPAADARVRFDVLAAPPPPLGTVSRLLIALSPFEPIPDAFYQKGVGVAFAAQLHRVRPKIKQAAFVVQRRPYPLGQPQAYEHLILGETGHILEGSSSNVYGVRDGVLWTAPAGVLEGITRKIILKLAADIGLPVRLEAIHADDLASFQEACLSSSTRGIIPVIRIGGQRIGDGRPGPVTRQLMAAYDQYVAIAARPAVSQRATQPDYET